MVQPEKKRDRYLKQKPLAPIWQFCDCSQQMVLKEPGIKRGTAECSGMFFGFLTGLWEPGMAP